MKIIISYRKVIANYLLAMSLVLTASKASAIVLHSGNVDVTPYSNNKVVTVAETKPVLEIGSLNSATLMKAPVYEEVEIVNSIHSSVQPIVGLDVGVYTLALTDFEFPEMFDSLGASITSATEMVGSLLLGENKTSDTLIFEIEHSDTYYLSVFGNTGSAYNLGLYGVEISKIAVSAVPLPGAVYLFFSGILGLMCIGKVKKIRLFIQPQRQCVSVT